MKKRITSLSFYLLLFIIPFSHSNAQDLNCDVFSFGDVAYDLLIAADPSLNLYHAGRTDFLLVKHNSAGTLQWSKPAGGLQATALTTDANGNVYIAGLFLGSVTFGSITLNNSTAGKSNIYVVKYDTDGVVQWAIATGEVVDNVLDIAVDVSGNVFLAGKVSGSGNIFGSTTLSSSAISGDSYVAKLNNTGTVLWAKASVSDFYASLGGLAVDTDGNAYLAGLFSSSVKFGATSTLSASGSSGQSDVFVAKYDPDGTALWAKSYFYTGNDAAYDIAAGADGNIYVTGVLAQSQLFIFKYNSSGFFQWSRTASGLSASQGNSIAVDSDGNAYVTGYFTGSNVTIGDTTLYGDDGNLGKEALVLKVDSDSFLSWAGQGTGDGDEEGTAICISNDATLYFAGYTQSESFTLGHTTLTGPTEFVANMLKENIVTAITDNNKLQNNLFPNPTSGTVQISGLEEAVWKVKINTLNGLCIYQSEQSGSTLTLDLSAQAKGIYMLELYKDDTYSGVAKLVVE
ncbi:MAG: type sorting protein [Chitinophagaceae bacterium]|nr:type sorting protein [Chitinophagaceae bacterium]